MTLLLDAVGLSVAPDEADEDGSKASRDDIDGDDFDSSYSTDGEEGGEGEGEEEGEGGRGRERELFQFLKNTLDTPRVTAPAIAASGELKRLDSTDHSHSASPRNFLFLLRMFRVLSGLHRRLFGPLSSFNGLTTDPDFTIETSSSSREHESDQIGDSHAALTTRHHKLASACVGLVAAVGTHIAQSLRRAVETGVTSDANIDALFTTTGAGGSTPHGCRQSVDDRLSCANDVSVHFLLLYGIASHEHVSLLYSICVTLSRALSLLCHSSNSSSSSSSHSSSSSSSTFFGSEPISEGQTQETETTRMSMLFASFDKPALHSWFSEGCDAALRQLSAELIAHAIAVKSSKSPVSFPISPSKSPSSLNHSGIPSYGYSSAFSEEFGSLSNSGSSSSSNSDSSSGSGSGTQDSLRAVEGSYNASDSLLSGATALLALNSHCQNQLFEVFFAERSSQWGQIQEGKQSAVRVSCVYLVLAQY